jgi:outer membrane protein TolC
VLQDERQSLGIEHSLGLLTLINRLDFLIRATIAIAFVSGLAGVNCAQQPETPAPQPVSLPQNTQPPSSNIPAAGAPVRITLEQAIALARKNEPTYRAAVTNARIAGEDRVQARDSLLPTAQFVTSDLYTQPNNSAYRVRYIANNAPHEYVSQGNVHEQLDAAAFANYRRTAALAAAAKAQAEIASRGLVVTVMQTYFSVASAEQKVAIAKRISDEGDKFLQLTKDLEAGGEVAHSDVIKAELQTQDRHRQYSEAQLARLNARLDLSVLLFPGANDNFELADDLHANIPLLPRGEFESQAAHENPEIRAALAAVQAANQDVTAARAGYLPTITLDYFYGIDAERYATYTPATPPDTGRFPNLGTSTLVALTLPLWNWGATQSQVRQAELRRDQTKVELSYEQRKLLAEMRSLYSEAETALNELAGLQHAAELATESLRLTTLRYKNGESTVLEVVDAETTFAAANSNYQDGAVRYRVALANLQTLTGVLTTP